jgi:hypothetical protein
MLTAKLSRTGNNIRTKGAKGPSKNFQGLSLRPSRERSGAKREKTGAKRFHVVGVIVHRPGVVHCTGCTRPHFIEHISAVTLPLYPARC